MTFPTFVSNRGCACYRMTGFFLLAIINNVSASKTSTATMLTISGVLEGAWPGVELRVVGVDCCTGDGVEMTDTGLTISAS